MKEKIIRWTTIFFSSLLLALSVGVIVWIVRDEGVRLAERERAALEAAERAYVSESQSVKPAGDTEKENAEKALRDIETLMGSLSNEDIPEE